jgi:FkbM family methyltransferase
LSFTQIPNYIPGINLSSFWFNSDFEQNHFSAELNALSSIFKDSQSIALLDQIIKFRETGNPLDHPDGDGLHNQYFNPGIQDWLNIKNITMVDCGAYNGDSVLAALHLNLPISKAYCFEADTSNFIKLTQTLNKINGIQFLPTNLATWSESATLTFSNSGEEGSRVDNNSGFKVSAIALDDYLKNDHFNFLKIDVEGADLNTLIGAIKTIERNRPYISVAIYHRPKDLWEIPLFLFSNFTNYKFYLRLHGHNLIETILYGVPT